MKCPKCDGNLSALAIGGRAGAHRCERCHGILCDRSALDRMQRAWFLWPKSRPESHIDIGDPGVGRSFDKLGEIDCPACGQRMDAISDPSQPHIWLEHCAACDRMYFDAGEITDLRYDTFADRIRDLIKGARQR